MKFLLALLSTLTLFAASPQLTVQVDTNGLITFPIGMKQTNDILVATNILDGRLTATGSTIPRYLSDRATDITWARDYNVIPDDGVDDQIGITNAIWAAKQKGGSTVVLPEGEITSTADIRLFDNVDLTGTGLQGTFLNQSNGVYSSAGILAEGTVTALPDLYTTVLAGDKTLTFASAHNLVVNDVIRLQNTNEFSYSLARAYYKQGEVLRVVAINNTTNVSLETRAFGSYLTTATKSWKVNSIRSGASNFRHTFQKGIVVPAIKFTFATQSKLQSLVVNGSQHSQIYVDRCYEMIVQNNYLFDDQVSIGNNYGLLIGDSQRIDEDGNYTYTTRHGTTHGGGIGTAAIISREIRVKAGVASSSLGLSTGLDFHGNVEHASVDGVFLPNGMNVGGDHIKVQNCEIWNDNVHTYFIGEGEQVGPNFTYSNNKFVARQNMDSGINALIRWTTTRSGSWVIRDNEFHLGNYVTGTYPTAVTSTILAGVSSGTNGPSLTTYNQSFDISNNKFFSDQTTNGPLYHIYITTTPTSGVARASIKNNFLQSGGIRITRNVETYEISGNTASGAQQKGLYLISLATPIFAKQYLHINDNLIYNSESSGIDLGTDTNTVGFVQRNTVINNAKTPTASVLDTSLYVTGDGDVRVYDNIFGDTLAVPNQNNVFYINGADNVRVGRNRNVGENVNALIPVIINHTRLREEEPSDGPIWDYDAKGFEWGVNGASYSLPYIFRRDTNAFVFWTFQNKIAAGNTSVGMGLNVMGGAIGNAASGFLGAFSQDHSLAYRAGSFGLYANGDADGITLNAEAAAQWVRIRAGGTTLTHEFFTNGVSILERTAVATPAAGFGHFYPKTDNLPYFMNDAGTEYELSGATKQPLDPDLSAIANNNPGNNYYFGTDGSGVKNFYTLPSAAIYHTTLSSGDLTTAITAAGNKAYWRAPYACTIVDVRGSLLTGSSAGNVTVDIHASGVTVMATDKITIEASETSSETAVTQPTVTDTSLADDELVTVDVDAAGANAAGLQVKIYYTRN